ncbi:MarR family winged helix-turn-helix transcriptional regulator [Mastigocladopsis repens]|uniref:MarR family winged helix-turn-helix transcriptional regulator n=1 Tax=Mastigocladopsis repens TaxID=221287 RepID=UPI00030130B0|nr:MarR family transcriptional regulator [Mastigocladopsis repens]
MNQSIKYHKILNLYRAQAIVEVALDAALSALGLSTAQWGTLRILREHPGASGADIARIAYVTPQAVATMLQRLEQAGLITRRPPSRGRAVETHLTPRGEALLSEGDRIADEIEARLFSSFSVEEQEIFNEYLLRCISTLDSKIINNSHLS